MINLSNVIHSANKLYLSFNYYSFAFASIVQQFYQDSTNFLISFDISLAPLRNFSHFSSTFLQFSPHFADISIANSFIMTWIAPKESLETDTFPVFYALAPFIKPAREKSKKKVLSAKLCVDSSRRKTKTRSNSNWKLIQKHCMNKCQ